MGGYIYRRFVYCFPLIRSTGKAGFFIEDEVKRCPRCGKAVKEKLHGHEYIYCSKKCSNIISAHKRHVEAMASNQIDYNHYKCNKCGEIKILDEFTIRSKIGKDIIYKKYCKECTKKQKKIYYRNNEGRFALAGHVRYLNHKEHIIACSKIWREKHPDETSIYRGKDRFTRRDDRAVGTWFNRQGVSMKDVPIKIKDLKKYQILLIREIRKKKEASK